jgi:hypothetical protein
MFRFCPSLCSLSIVQAARIRRIRLLELAAEDVAADVHAEE